MVKNRAEREGAIQLAIDSGELESLQEFAVTDGLLSCELRLQAWPLLLPVDLQRDFDTWRHLPAHNEEDQVQLDVDRVRPFAGSNYDAGRFKKDLKNIICHVLRSHPKLSYYQGYHDVAAVFLIALQGYNPCSLACLEAFTLIHLRDFMMPTLMASLQILDLVPRIIQKLRPGVYTSLMLDKIEPFFCLSPVVTLFTHDVGDFDTLVLVVDCIIASGSISPVLYTYSSLVIQSHEKILEKVGVTDDDIFTREDLIHNALSKFLSNVTASQFQESLHEGMKAERKLPLSSLFGFDALGKYSVLRTIRAYPDGKHFDEELLTNQTIESDSLKRVQSGLYTPKGFLAELVTNKTNQNILKASLLIGVAGIILNTLVVTGSK